MRASVLIFSGLACGFVSFSCVPLQVMEFSSPMAPIPDKPAQWYEKGFHSVDPASVTGWVNDFNNPVLVKLSHEAVENNFSIDAARERVFAAEELARALRGNLFPALDLNQSSTRSQTLSPVGQVQTKRHALTLGLRWEVDLWKRLHDLKEAQVAAMDAQFHAYQAARLSLVANVMKAAFELIESTEQIALSEKNLKSLLTNLDILNFKLEAGNADDRTALDIALSRSDIARARSTIVAEQRDQDEARRVLETLLGRYPKGIIVALKSLPDPKRVIPVGVPSDLLLRRPDILEGERGINRALYNLSATRKQLLPSFNLNGEVGTQSNELFRNLLDLDNLVWSITRSVTQPVFEGGRIRSEIRVEEHRRDELIASYANLVLNAFREVEVALSNERYYNEQVKALEENVKEALLAEALSLANYEKGIIEIITLLESQRRSFDAQSGLLNVRLFRLLNRVDLYLALGGDFDKPATCVAIPVEDGLEYENPGNALKWFHDKKRPSGDYRGD